MQLEIIAAMMQRRGEMLRLQEEKVEEEGKATCRAANPNCMPASMRRQRCYRPGLKQQHHTAATQMGATFASPGVVRVWAQGWFGD